MFWAFPHGQWINLVPKYGKPECIRTSVERLGGCVEAIIGLAKGVGTHELL